MENAKTNLVLFPGTGERSPLAILQLAQTWGLKEVVVAGFDESGEFCIAGSNGDFRDVSWILRKGQQFVDSQTKL